MPTLPVFTEEQCQTVQRLLATKVVQMGGRKLEEGDWNEIYCEALGIDKAGWSNLKIDVVHRNLGVEQKLIRTKSHIDIATTCGTSIMHPSLTRSFRLDTTLAPDDAMRSVLQQYAELVETRKTQVREASKLPADAEVEMRNGWLLWQDSLRQFLYFEEPMTVPNPDDYRAIWQDTPARGARKPSRSLWIFEKTGAKRKRYSVTTEAGGKIQPYFDVPPPDDENLYIWTVIGEVLVDKYVRAWITERTKRELTETFGSVEPESLSNEILRITEGGLNHTELREFMASEERAADVVVSSTAYEALCEAFDAANDELRFRALLVHTKRNGA